MTSYDKYNDKFNAQTGITWKGELHAVSYGMQDFLTAMPILYSGFILMNIKL